MARVCCADKCDSDLGLVSRLLTLIMHTIIDHNRVHNEDQRTQTASSTEPKVQRTADVLKQRVGVLLVHLFGTLTLAPNPT